MSKAFYLSGSSSKPYPSHQEFTALNMGIDDLANSAAVIGFPFLLATWIKDDIKELKYDVGKKFDVEKKFDDVGKKFDDIEKKFNKSDNKIKLNLIISKPLFWQNLKHKIKSWPVMIVAQRPI
jgi:hypothetical protein